MSELNQRAEAIFEAAIRLPHKERAAYLDQVCGEDAQLHQRVIDALFKAQTQTTATAESPRPPAPNGTIALPEMPQQPGEKVGDRIGRYKLLEERGQGGMGTVYVAQQQEPVRRKVAFKVIRLGMDTKQVIARFEAERQALALMDHPNIAKVLDAGATDTGRPYFVMEFVNGVPITEYCDTHNLPTTDRLALFIQVCQAIQHAHQKGIIHRDIKPSNILVTLQEDGTPAPKVIDFGIAKATAGQRLTHETIYTAIHEFIGTPAYMSPEQAEMTALDIDTRSDIYSLGVLLYELLIGTTPFDAKRLGKAGPTEIRRILREEEPPRPSTKLSTLTAEEQTTTATRRQSEPPKLIHLVRGDLDWIVMKTLEKDRTRRYETANALGADIKRFLNTEPVVARPPSRIYWFQQLVRRNKLAFTAVGAVVAALIIGLGASTWMFVRERDARKQTEAEAEKNQQAYELFGQVFAAIFRSASAGARRQIAGVVDEATKKLDTKEMQAKPELEAHLRVMFGHAYGELGEPEKAQDMFRKVLELRPKIHGDANRDVVVAFSYLGFWLARSGDFVRAESMYREAIRTAKNVSNGISPEAVEARGMLADLQRARGNLSDAETQYREALAGLHKLPSSDFYAGRAVGVGASSYSQLADVLLRQGKYGELKALLPEAAEHGDPQVWNSLAWLLATCNDSKVRDGSNAVIFAEKSVGATNQKDPNILDTLAAAYAEAGQFVHAVSVQKEAIALVQDEGMKNDFTSRLKLYESNSPFRDQSKELTSPAREPGTSFRDRGISSAQHGNWRDAVANLRKATELDPGEHWNWYHLAPLLVEAGDLEGYRNHSRAMLARFGGTNAPYIAERTAKACSLLPMTGDQLQIVGNLAERAVSLGTNDDWFPWYEFAKGLTEYRQGRFASAAEWMGRVHADAQRDPSNYRDASAFLVLAMARQRLSQPDEARSALAQGVEVVRLKMPRLDSGDLGNSWHDVLMVNIIMREAQALIEGEPKNH